MPLAAAIETAEFKGLTLWCVSDGWQANLSTDGTSWHVCHGATPVEALSAVFGLRTAPPVPVLPPPPY